MLLAEVVFAFVVPLKKSPLPPMVVFFRCLNICECECAAYYYSYYAFCFGSMYFDTKLTVVFS